MDENRKNYKRTKKKRRPTLTQDFEKRKGGNFVCFNHQNLRGREWPLLCFFVGEGKIEGERMNEVSKKVFVFVLFKYYVKYLFIKIQS